MFRLTPVLAPHWLQTDLMALSYEKKEIEMLTCDESLETAYRVLAYLAGQSPAIGIVARTQPEKLRTWAVEIGKVLRRVENEAALAPGQVRKSVAAAKDED